MAEKAKEEFSDLDKMLGLNKLLDDPITDEVGKEFKVTMDDTHENYADMAEKAKEELEDKSEGSHRLGRPWTKKKFDKAAELTE
ncbi:uncharacterized protein FTJAE_8381 [Fusarium tjaetaba]|uniref:Uncharacterized protein n=1 Tax=Fusarium tjaetaba TaxID=1567544 RepID=A0A8H5R8I2_9HYPO|nr:uncharacterized protein FTJAE_8381 [Fusarium tjaetaba]KAF5630011.1 hypothetical protein FTJAE_8381 [Fusarium tjaetaba]